MSRTCSTDERLYKNKNFWMSDNFERRYHSGSISVDVKLILKLIFV